ncbi:hypothetical protein [Saccharothrix sp. Mg75]|uniref:hypothetical protein n=1 Tax=Saccharothrix sp. Mg75 TaxID=3445357 RepID=UPI003EE9E87A
MGDNKHGGHGGGHHGGGNGGHGGGGHNGNHNGNHNGGHGQGHGGGGHGGGHHGGHGGGGHEGGREKPTDLGQKVDWMTYSHQQLWEMVNTGVDLKAAGSAQADWATVGKALGEVQELLALAISRSAQAWEGGTADRAREALESVEKWALNTSEHADNVAKCIATEIEHVQTAREMMPPPAPAPPAVTPVEGATGTPVATPVATPTPVATTRSPFVNEVAAPVGHDALTPTERGIGTPRLGGQHGTGAFVGIDTIAAPAVDSVVAADAGHRQAAEVMALFQQNSYAVDRTVPSFAPPVNPVAPPPPPPVVVTGGPVTAPSAQDGVATGGPVAVNNQQQHQQQGNQQRPGGGQQAFGRGGFAGARGGYGGGRGGGPVPVGPVGGGGGGAGSPLSAPGTTSGTLGGDRGSGSGTPGSVTSTFQAPKSVTPQAGMIGAAPMAAPPPVAGGGVGGERDHNRPNYLEDDENVFGLDNKAAPPVIGL